MVRTHTSSMLAASVSLSLWESCLIDLVGHILLLPSILSDFYNLSFASKVLIYSSKVLLYQEMYFKVTSCLLDETKVSA